MDLVDLADDRDGAWAFRDVDEAPPDGARCTFATTAPVDTASTTRDAPCRFAESSGGIASTFSPRSRMRFVLAPPGQSRCRDVPRDGKPPGRISRAHYRASLPASPSANHHQVMVMG
jgi:hypothetical protein